MKPEHEHCNEDERCEGCGYAPNGPMRSVMAIIEKAAITVIALAMIGYWLAAKAVAIWGNQ